MLRRQKERASQQQYARALTACEEIRLQLQRATAELAEGWNFGPSDDEVQPVEWVTEKLMSLWGGEQGWQLDGGVHPHEARVLKLDTSKARSLLGWRPKMNLETALRQVVEWHQTVRSGGDAQVICLEQIARFRDGRVFAKEGSI